MASKSHLRALEIIEEALRESKIDYERNGVELVFAEHDFNVHSTIDAFRSEEANVMLFEWKSVARKNRIEEISRTSTPRPSENKRRPRHSVHLSASTPTAISAEPTSPVSGLKQPPLTVYNEMNREIEVYKESIKQYETKMEECLDSALRDYYIKSALTVREQIRLLESDKSKLIESHTSEQITRLSNQVNYLLAQNNLRIRTELDCWDSSSTRTREEQQEFKNSLIVYYECGSPLMKTIKCMVMNKYFERSMVRAAHIWKASTRGVGLSKFQLDESNVNNERNGLLLYESIERAFDSKQVCLLYDPFAGVLRLKVLCSDLNNSFVVADEQLREKFHETRKFADIDNAILMLPTGIYPYRRLLNWHGRCSYRTAKLRNWIGLDENLEDFFHLSDLISLPGDDHDEGDDVDR